MAFRISLFFHVSITLFIAASSCIAMQEAVAHKNVIFDIGGVLLAGDAKEFAQKLFGQPKAALYADALKSEAWSNWDKGLCSKEELIAILSASLVKDEVIQFMAAFLSADRQLIAECAERVKTLKAQGYKLFILSNFAQETHALFTQVYKDFFNLFDDCLFSFQVGCTKPDPMIYALLLKKFSLQAENCVFIDDSEANVIAARKCGITSIHYKPGNLEKELNALGI